MPRPRKWRKVCCMPESTQFGPLVPAEGSPVIVQMTVEEYETIRLIDLEGFTQEECADQMAVARTTAQRIYADARKKIAESLVLGKVLRIEGGELVRAFVLRRRYFFRRGFCFQPITRCLA